jgi:uncharacterized protein (TIGR03000 family)
VGYVHVRVPPAAQVLFDNAPTQQKGPDRVFVTPPLDGSRGGSYQVTARWTQNGAPINVTRMVPVMPGRTVDVDFTSAPVNSQQ